MWRGKHRGTPGGVLSHSRASTVTVPMDVIRRWIGTRTFSAVESRESYYSIQYADSILPVIQKVRLLQQDRGV